MNGNNDYKSGNIDQGMRRTKKCPIRFSESGRSNVNLELTQQHRVVWDALHRRHRLLHRHANVFDISSSSVLVTKPSESPSKLAKKPPSCIRSGASASLILPSPSASLLKHAINKAAGIAAATTTSIAATTTTFTSTTPTTFASTACSTTSTAFTAASATHG